MTKGKAIVDDVPKSATELWEEIRRIYTTSNNHQIANIINPVSEKRTGFRWEDGKLEYFIVNVHEYYR